MNMTLAIVLMRPWSQTYLFSLVHFSLPTPIFRFLYGMPAMASLALAFFSKTAVDPIHSQKYQNKTKIKNKTINHWDQLISSIFEANQSSMFVWKFDKQKQNNKRKKHCTHLRILSGYAPEFCGSCIDEVCHESFWCTYFNHKLAKNRIILQQVN